ncbi:MAG: hypothetical protein Q7T96_08870 [Methylobacter sp.]|nr:hypothetical protein [Methylobacter sp.]
MFVTVLMRCTGTELDGEKVEQPFRLATGLRKIDRSVSSSIPAT